MVNNDIVAAYAIEWDKYSISTNYLEKVCEYLDRTRLKKKLSSSTTLKASSSTSGKLLSVKQVKKGKISFDLKIINLQMAYSLWEEHIFWYIHDNHANKLIFQIFEYIEHDRDGRTIISSQLIKNSIKSLSISPTHSQR